MAAYYFESGAVVKRHITDTGSAWVSALAHPSARNRIYTANITLVEVIAAITRRARGGSLPMPTGVAAIRQLRLDMATDYRIVEVNSALLTRAADLAESRAVRGYDALQLAAALEANDARIAQGADPLTLVSADSELNAAVAEGLEVEDPNAHP